MSVTGPGAGPFQVSKALLCGAGGRLAKRLLLAKFCPSKPGLSTTGARLKPDIQSSWPQSGSVIGRPR
jgi:hypothetical protein